MAKINIHIELDTKVDTLETLVTIAHAFGGKVTLEPRVAPAEIKMADPEPKVDEPKKGKKSTKHQEIKLGEVFDIGQGVPGVNVEALPESIQKETDSEPEVTIDDVRTVVADAKRAGKKGLKDILIKHGAETVSTLDPKQYKSVIDAVKAL